MKIKCGSYNTIGMDIKGMVYIWGKGGLNLDSDHDKHKLVPEMVFLDFE